MYWIYYNCWNMFIFYNIIVIFFYSIVNMGKEISELKSNRNFTDVAKYRTAHEDWKGKKGDYSKFEFSGDTSDPIFIYGYSKWDTTPGENSCVDIATLTKAGDSIALSDRRGDPNYKKVAYTWNYADGKGWGDNGHAWSDVYFGGDHTYNRDKYVTDNTKSLTMLTSSVSNSKFHLNGVLGGDKEGRKGTEQREWVCTKPQLIIEQEKQDYIDAEPILNLNVYCNNKDTVTSEYCKDWCLKGENRTVCDAPMEKYCSEHPSDTDYCGCFNFDDITKKVMNAASSKGISLLPQCNVLKCINTAYKTSNMNNTKSCPTVQLCIQSIDIGKTEQADFKGVSFSCDQESKSTTQVTNSKKSSNGEDGEDDEDTEEDDKGKTLGLESQTFYIVIGSVAACCCSIILMIILFVMSKK
ncbi:hypothetical protein CCP3SC1AL1_1990001 [Gammaproteobacteria bacterium]